MNPVLLKCDNCNTDLVGEYCHVCGQSGQPVQTSFSGFLHELLTNLLGADSRLIRSLHRLVLSPGRLTQEWIEGHRNRYISPIQLYLLMAGAFFLLHAYHPFIQFIPDNHSITSSLTGAAITYSLTEIQLSHLDSASVSLEVFKERFDTQVSVLLGPLLIVIVVLFSFLTAAVVRRGHPYAHHAVFTLHWCSFFLLVELIRRIVGGGKIGEIIAFVLGTVYLVTAIARVYRGWIWAIIVGPVLMLSFIFLIGLWMSATLWISLP